MSEFNTKRCQSIAANIQDKLYAIRSELTRDYQSGKYLMEKIESVVWDANVLKNEFDLLQKYQEMKGDDKDEDTM